MRRTFSVLLAALLIVNICGCSKQPDTPLPDAPPATSADTTLPTTNTLTQIHQQPMIAASMPIITNNLTDDNNRILTQHIYQNLELIVPDQDVADAIIIDYLNRIDKHQATAATLYSEAASLLESGNFSEAFLLQSIFEAERLDHSIFSLFGTIVTLKGHAHPDVNTESVTYDLVTGKPLELSDILHPDAEASSLYPAVIASLQKQKSTIDFYEGFENIVSESFESPNNWYLSDTGLVFYYPPYQIAPYASGIVTAEVPYGEMANILNDAYFPAESDKFNGDVHLEPFDPTALNQFSQIAEVVCTQDAAQVILHTDGLLQNLRIKQLREHDEFTVFSSYYLSPGDGIIIYATANDVYQLHYTADGKPVTKTVRITPSGAPEFID